MAIFRTSAPLKPIVCAQIRSTWAHKVSSLTGTSLGFSTLSFEVSLASGHRTSVESERLKRALNPGQEFFHVQRICQPENNKQKKYIKFRAGKI